MWRDVCLKRAWIPQLANKFSKACDKYSEFIARWSFDMRVVLCNVVMFSISTSITCSLKK